MIKVKTGPMRFGNDWTGTYIRGSDGSVYTTSLKRVLAAISAGTTVDPLDIAIFDKFISVLEGSPEPGWTPVWEDIQLLNEFETCLRFRFKKDLNDY